MKTVDFSKTIAACDLKVGMCRQLIELAKVYEVILKVKVNIYGTSGPISTYEKLKLTFLRNHWAIFNQFLYVSFWVHGNENL